MSGSFSDGKHELSAGAIIILTAFIGMALGTTGLYLYTQGLFIRPLQEEFGWSRGQAAMMPSVFGLAMALTIPLAGFALDRFGHRYVIPISILMLSGGFFALSWMTGHFGVHIAVILLIALSGGGLSIGYIRLVAAAFEKARGLALGLTMTGTGVIGLLAPALLGAFMEQASWRVSYQVLALIALAALPFVLIFANDRNRIAAARPADPAQMSGLTRGEAFRSPRFWLMGLSFFCAGMALSGLLPHFVPLMQDFGMSTANAGATFGAVGLSVIVGRIAAGWACDRIFAPYIVAGILALGCLAFIGLLLLGAPFLIAASVMIGFGLGAEIDLAGYLSARYFGMRAYGAVLGIQYGLYGLGAGFGIAMFGILHDQYGSYQVALGAGAALLAVSVVSALLLGPYPQLPKAQKT